MKIAIVDDQREFLDSIRDIISDTYDEIYSFISVYEMEKTNDDFDLILLDIDMPDCDGVDYSKEHKDKNIIFITSQNQRMKDAFGNNVYGFIEKHDTKERYRGVIDKAIEQIFNEESVLLKINNEIKCFIQRDIVYFMYIGYKTVCLVYREETYTVKGYTLNEIKEKIDSRFIYISRDIIINTRMIVDYIGQKIYLKGVRQGLPISRRKKSEIREFLENKKEGDQ